MMIKNIKYTLIGTILSCLMAASHAISVYNYLGTGSSPNLSMILSATGVSGWQITGSKIGYAGGGGIPCSSNANNNWSAWNIEDSNKVYYGTITLTTDAACSKIIYNPTGCPKNPNSLCYTNTSGNGAALSGIVVNNSFYLSVGSITCPNNNCSGGGGSGPFSGTPASQPPANFTLSVSGNQILANGNPIIIKGIVRPSLEWNNQGQYLSQTDIKNMASFAGSNLTNAIRIDMNAAYWNSSAPSTTSGSYQQIIDAMVYYATQNNMLVILDYHWFNDQVKQQNMAAKDATNASIVFWKSVANKYKNYGNVIFELYNEPHSLPYNTWLNGDSQWYGMQDLYNAVRSTGAKNLVIANGLDYAYYVGFLGISLNNCNNGQTNCLVKDSSQSNGLAYNIIYGTHPYDSKGSAGYTYYPTGGGNPMPADFASNFAGLQNSQNPYPLIATEFGDNQAKDYPPNNNNYISTYTFILNSLKQYGVNYTGFAWWIDPNQPYFPALICGSWSNPSACFGGSYVKNDMINNPATQLNFDNNLIAKAKK